VSNDRRNGVKIRAAECRLNPLLIAIAAIRFLITAKNIDSEDLRHGPGSRIDVALAALLVLLGSALFIYLSHAFVATG
jgi:hypothetical protein